MAVLNPTAAQILSETWGLLTFGQAAGYQTPNSGGDSFPLLGSYVWFTFKTAGTASTVTADSVELSNFGQDNNPVMTLGATDEQDFIVKCDARFKQVSGNVGSINFTYTSVVALTIKAKYIP